jgi:hypothetical protein
MSQLASLFAPGTRVFVCGAVGEPTGLVETLSRETLPDNLHFVQFPLPGYNTTDFTAWGPTVEMTTFFMTPALKDAPPERLHFLPMQMRAVFDYLQRLEETNERTIHNDPYGQGSRMEQNPKEL